MKECLRSGVRRPHDIDSSGVQTTAWNSFADETGKHVDANRFLRQTEDNRRNSIQLSSTQLVAAPKGYYWHGRTFLGASLACSGDSLMKRVMVFMDHSNFFLALRMAMRSGDPIEERSFDYSAFISALAGEDDLIRAYLAGSFKDTPERDDPARRFFHAVDGRPHVYVKLFERREGGEKQVDVYLATQIVALAYENAYDIAYLVTGDEDFCPAIELVQQKGKIVVAASFNKSLSHELTLKADRILRLDGGTRETNHVHWQNFILTNK